MRRRNLLLFFAGVWLPYLAWWLALYPGGLWIDSFEVWGQVTSGHWDNHHPAPYVALVWLTSFGGRSISAATFIQTLFVAGSVAYLAYTLYVVRRTGRAPLVVAAALGWLPFLGPFSVVLEKDVWELGALVVLGAELVRVATPPAQRLMSRVHWTTMFLSALLATLVRWNGAATIVITAAVLLAGLPSGRRLRVGGSLIAAAAIGFATLVGIPRISSVAPVNSADRHFEALADIGTYAADKPATFTETDRALLERMAPFAQWRKFGAQGCDTVNYITFRLLRHHRYDVMRANVAQIERLWRDLVWRSPTTMVRARLCRAALAWSPVSLNGRPISTVWPTIAPNGFGITAQPVLPALGRVGRAWARPSTDNIWVQALGWRPVAWFVGLAAVLLLWPSPRGRWRSCANDLALPVGVLLSFAIAPAAQDARYAYPAVVLCQLLLAAAIAGRRRHSDSGGDATDT